jgi:hypothetical protein
MTKRTRKLLNLVSLIWIGRFMFSTLLVIVFISCNQNCARTIYGLDFYGISKIKNDSLLFDDWYKTDSFSNDLSLYIELEVFGGGEFCNYYMENKVIEDSIQIYCNHGFIANNDSIRAYSDLINFLKITKREHETYLDVGYFVDLNKTNNQFLFEKQDYTFWVDAKTTDGLVLSDSCIIEMR